MALPAFLNYGPLSRRSRYPMAVPNALSADVMDDSRANPPLPTPAANQPVIVPESAPERPAVPEPFDPNGVGAPPVITTDRRGHPKLMPVTPDVDGLERARQYREAVQGYEPQAEKGWRRWLIPLAMNALAGGGHGAGLAGVLGGAGVGLLRGGFDPEGQNRAWKERELGRADRNVSQEAQIADMAQNSTYRKKQIENIDSEIRARDKEKDARPNPTSYRVLTMTENGLPAGTKIQREFDPQTKSWHDAVDVNGTPIVLDAVDAVKEGKRPIREIGGSIVEQQEDGSWKPVYTAPDKPEKETEDFTELRNNYYKKQVEQEQEAERLKGELEKVPADVTGDLFGNATKAEQRKAIQAEIKAAQKSARDYRDEADKANAKIRKGTRVTSSAGSTGTVNLEGAITEFKKQAKRNPTAAEIENIKKYYGLQ